MMTSQSILKLLCYNLKPTYGEYQMSEEEKAIVKKFNERNKKAVEFFVKRKLTVSRKERLNIN